MSPLVRNLALVLLVVFLGWFLYEVRSVVNPLILGYLTAFILHPLVLGLERRGWKRRNAVNVIFATFALVVALTGVLLWFQGRALGREFSREEGFGQKIEVRVEQALRDYSGEIDWALKFFPDVREGLRGATAPEGAPADTGKQPTELTASQLASGLRSWWDSWFREDKLQQSGALGLKAAGGAVLFVQKLFGSLFDFLVLIGLLPIYTYFLLFELERIHRFVAKYLPRADRERLVRIGSQIGEVLSTFFRGRLLVAAAKGGFLALGLWVAGIDFALLLGFGGGAISLIPFVGVLVGFVLSMLVGFLEYSLVEATVRVGIVFLTAEFLENYFLIPRIIGDKLGLHTVVVIFALMAGGAAMGMFGLLIALPLAATLVILAREFLLPMLEKFAEEEARS
jgi:predicted PurR-regulated permease PerM